MKNIPMPRGFRAELSDLRQDEFIGEYRTLYVWHGKSRSPCAVHNVYDEGEAETLAVAAVQTIRDYKARQRRSPWL